MENNTEHKPLYRFAGTIKRDYANLSGEAKERVTEMFNLDQITEENARNTVLSFLIHSKNWKGIVAVGVKKELAKIANQQAA